MSLALFVFGQIRANGDFNQPLDSAVNNILTQVLLFPQEKIYLQTDRPCYISGETLFFRIFLLNAFSHQPSDISRYVYVELLNPLDSVVLRHQIRPENNLHYGTFTLPETLAQGNYRIRAYTRFMENMGEDYFFTQVVQIVDPQIASLQLETEFDFINEKEIGVNLRFLNVKTKQPLLANNLSLRLNQEKNIRPKTDKEGWVRVKFDLPTTAEKRILSVGLDFENYKFQQYISLPYPEDRFDVNFYPEGGHLISGQVSTVAFKALDSGGNAVSIRGEVFDSDDDKIIEFTTYHDGMGQFSFTPESEKHYYVLCYHNDKNIRVDLPKSQSDVFSLKTFWRQEKLWIRINKPSDLPWQKLYLLVHTGGFVNYSAEWDSSKEFIILDKADLPSGVSHLLLLTEDFQPVSERLVFALNGDWLSAELTHPKSTYKKRDLVELGVKLKDYSADSNFSISITDDKDVTIDTTRTILSGILLTSELRGHIANPSYYFQLGNKKAELAADLLMQTHGWTRYNIPKAMRGEYQYLTIPHEETQIFSGLVKGGLFSKPYAGSGVTLMSIHSAFLETTVTDEKGRFEFNGFEFPDSTNYILRALTKKGDYTVELELDEITYPSISSSISLFPLQNRNDEIVPSTFLDYVTKADLRYTYENGMRMIYLPELEIKSSLGSKRKYQTSYAVEPDESISQEEIENSSASDVGVLISRLPGVTYSSGVIKIARKVSTSISTLAPLVIIDGMRMNDGPDDMEGAVEALSLLTPFDVAQIDVIKSDSKLSIYGSSAYGGVIEIFTKKGDRISNKLKFNTRKITPLGYQIPVEFYSPQYDTSEAIRKEIPDLRSTIYWKPNVFTDTNGEAFLKFYTADSSSSYSVVIEGISADGRLIHQMEQSSIVVE